MTIIMIAICVLLGFGLALLMGRLFGGSKRIETYLPNPPPPNNRRYWDGNKH